MFYFHVYFKSLRIYSQRALKNLYKVNLLLQDGPLEVGQDCPSLIMVPVKTLDITWGNDTRFWQPVALTDHDKRQEFSFPHLLIDFSHIFLIIGIST